MHKLPRSFYSRKTITVAKELLGKILVRNNGMSVLKAKIIETEAYLFDDPASHSFRGVTKRNKMMFGPAGILYVYFTYGMHYCANVVSYKEGIGEAVLIRAVEPIDGIDIMKKNRKVKDDRHLLKLTNGPAKLAQAFELTIKQSGTDLCHDEIFIADGPSVSRSKIIAATRIGISVAQKERLRFYIKGNDWVSKK